MVTPGRVVAALALCVGAVFSSVAQVASSDKLNGKSLEAAVSFAQSLAQWEFVIIGSSMLVMVGTSYYRPPPLRMRLFYLLFLPAWTCLFSSIYYGTRAQEAYVAYLILPVTTIEGAVKRLNEDIGNQISWMYGGLLFLGAWLIAYLFWWTFAKKVAAGQGDP